MMSFAAHVGVIASREHRPQFFTSNLYPLVFDESLNVLGVAPNRGILLTSPSDEFQIPGVGITGGTLTTTIRYPSYTHPTPEDFTMGQAQILSGNVTTTIAYKTYDHPRVESANITGINILGGALTVVINYTSYSGVIESYELSGVSITGGTLVNVV